MKLNPDHKIQFDNPEKLKRSEVLNFEGTEFDLKCIEIAEGDTIHCTNEEWLSVNEYKKLKLQPTAIKMPNKHLLKQKSTRNVRLFLSMVAAIITFICIVIFNAKQDLPIAPIIAEKIIMLDTADNLTVETVKLSSSDKLSQNNKPISPLKNKSLKSATIASVNTHDSYNPKYMIPIESQPILIPAPKVHFEIHNQPNVQEVEKRDFFASLFNFINKDKIEEAEIEQIIRNSRGAMIEFVSVKSGQTLIVQQFDDSGNLVKTKIVSPKPLSVDIQLASK